MRILVPFKIVPDPDRVLPEDLERFSPDLDLGYAGEDFGCFDASALELALRLKDQAPGTKCTAVTVAPRLAPDFTERLLSCGFDRVIRIPGSREFDPEAVARALAEVGREYDLILMGREASPAETGMVPWLLAGLLGIPLASGVENGRMDPDLILCCRDRGALWERRAALPLAVTLDNSPLVLRMATLRRRLQMKGREPEIRQVPEQEPREDLCLEPVREGRTCRMLDPEDPETFRRIRRLLETAGAPEARKSSGAVPPPETGLLCLPDTPGGRAEAVRRMLEEGRDCLFSCHAEQVGTETALVSRLCFGSGLLWKKTLRLPAVITCPELTQREEVQEPWVLSQRLAEPARETGLQTAALVLACGNGLGTRENAEFARKTAEELGAAFGLTRPGALNGWGSTGEILGQSGCQIGPGCCLAVGAAGAGAFLAGIRRAGIVIAVNTDPHALIFRHADWGIVMDAMEFLKKLGEKGESTWNG